MGLLRRVEGVLADEFELCGSMALEGSSLYVPPQEARVIIGLFFLVLLLDVGEFYLRLVLLEEEVVDLAAVHADILIL
jgi:ABC-type uncharacterized transport system YnjBCD ATPase subunit